MKPMTEFNACKVHRRQSRLPPDADTSAPAMRRIRIGLLLALGLGSSALSANALACGNAQGEIDIGTVSFDASVPVGTVLATISTTTINNTGRYNCGNYLVQVEYVGNGPVTSGNIYSTNVPGIGYRLGRSAQRWFPYSTVGVIGTSSGPVPVAVVVELVKTGEITRDDKLSGVAGFMKIGTTNFHTFTWGAGSEVEPLVPSCDLVVNGGRDVELGRHHAGVFSGVGSTSPAVAFNITSRGCNAEATRVHLAWRGAADPNDANAFRITSGQLRGAGVWIERVSNGETVVPNGARHSFDPLPSGEHYAYQARLKQTLPTITEGAGSAAITIEIAYN